MSTASSTAVPAPVRTSDPGPAAWCVRGLAAAQELGGIPVETVSSMVSVFGSYASSYPLCE